jgi:hypothetical protein
MDENPYESKVQLSRRQARHPVRNLIILSIACIVFMCGPLGAFITMWTINSWAERSHSVQTKP